MTIPDGLPVKYNPELWDVMKSHEASLEAVDGEERGTLRSAVNKNDSKPNDRTASLFQTLSTNTILTIRLLFPTPAIGGDYLSGLSGDTSLSDFSCDWHPVSVENRQS